MDLIIRNARLPDRPEAAPVDIGVANGRIAAIAETLAADAPHCDALGQLVCGGLVETHIHRLNVTLSGRTDRSRDRSCANVPAIA